MDELPEFCARVLGDGEAAERAVERARREGDDRTRALARAVAVCREVSAGNCARSSSSADGGGRQEEADREPEDAERGPAEADREPEEADREPEDAGRRLAEAVAGELARASARLPLGQREALALRQLGCSHAELASVVGIEASAVAPLLARARLRLRSEIRGGQAGLADCPERDRALRTIALRQDREEVPEADEDWLLEHLGHCAGCAQVHAAMLEASACYRAWRVAPAR
jgi:DNA-directed RNA polymerase specialized sigma24 family protein